MAEPVEEKVAAVEEEAVEEAEVAEAAKAPAAADGGDPSPVKEAVAPPPAPTAAARPRGFGFFGAEKKSVHKVLGGNKTADVLLWKDKKTTAAVIGGATVIWVLFEVIDYHFLTLISHLLIVSLVVLFLWSRATVLIKKAPANIPEVQISEEIAVNIARALRNDINRMLAMLREIASGHDLMKFLGVIVALWVLSEIGSCSDFLTLVYAAVLMLHTVPILYDKYQDKVDHYADKAMVELHKQYEVLDAKVLSKIPRGPAKAKKQH